MIRPVRRAHESALRGSCYGLLRRGFVMLLLLLLFVFRQLLLLVLFLVFLATLVAHACSFFSVYDLKSITARLIIRNRREPATIIAVGKSHCSRTRIFRFLLFVNVARGSHAVCGRSRLVQRRPATLIRRRSDRFDSQTEFRSAVGCCDFPREHRSA